VTPKSRERAYEKRRYEEWQERLAGKRARRRRLRNQSLIVGSGVLVVAIVVCVVLLTRPDKSSTTATPAASASTAANPCPAPTGKPDTSIKFSKAPPASDAEGKNWTLTMNTTCGALTVTLDGKKAPQTVAVMLKLAKAGFFNNTPCHRLTTSGIYVLQCGDPTGTGNGGPGFAYGPVENAPKNNVYPAGTVAMARQSDNGKSQGSQFFLVYKDSTIPSDSAGGYSVFGTITKGLDVVTKVADGGVSGGSTDGQPVRAVSIASTSVTAG
jgi:peptidyl-prolyl cis-trans isomerase B (cyclophilin B)